MSDDEPTARTVVITGSTSGVGRACAQLFARRGDNVALIARGTDGLDGAAADVRAAGRQVSVHAVDVADSDALEQAATAIERELGPIDVWVNNAMTSVLAPMMEVSADELRRVTEVTYLGAAYGTMVALRKMWDRNRGVIVQVGSALAYRGIPLQAPYCAAKHAIVGFTESVRTELMHEGKAIRISAVHLPAVNTPQFDHVLSRMPRRPQPVPPIYQPEVPARAIVEASFGRSMRWYVGWPTIKTIWGNRIAPEYADRVLARTGYDSQQTDEPQPADAPVNLWSPPAGDAGAHGRFDDRARPRGLHMTALRLRLLIAGALIAVALVLMAITAALTWWIAG